MSCSPSDLKDYLLGELRGAQSAAVEEHVAGCESCRAELRSLGLTRAALLSIPDEEPPRRIAFVSDKVFEPTWWQKLWRSGPQLGFASAAMLSCALLVHAFVVRPQQAAAPAPVPAPVARTVPAAPPVDVQGLIEKAVADSEERQAAKFADVLNAKLRDAEKRRREDLLAVGEYIEYQRKRQGVVRKSAFDLVSQ